MHECNFIGKICPAAAKHFKRQFVLFSLPDISLDKTSVGAHDTHCGRNTARNKVAFKCILQIAL